MDKKFVGRCKPGKYDGQGIALIVLSFIGLIKFTKYLQNHWMI